VHGRPTTFWGKLSRKTGEPGDHQWHPLFDHCADVAAVAERLLLLPVWHRRLSRLAGRQLQDADRARLAVFAAVHDVGKLNLGFQAKGNPELGPTAGHVQEAVAALVQGRALRSLVDSVLAWGEGAESLLLAAVCHHGRPHSVRSTSASWQASLWAPRAGLDPQADCASLLEGCRRWFPDAFETSAPLPDQPEFSHAFAGLVMLADWIGSDIRLFPYSETEADRMPLAREKAREAIRRLGLDVPAADRADIRRREAFDRVSPESPRPAQRAIGALPCWEGGGLAILEAETGSGKTEAAFSRFVELFDRGLVDGLYFALPTRSAATELHSRAVAAARRAFADPPPVVLAVPGYLKVDDVHGTRLAPFEVQWPDGGERLRYRGWAAESAKRFLVGCIVVGTIDQVLLSSLMVSHAHLRATALLRHLLVIDEVHASDAYMQRVLQHVLRRHLAAGGHALLLSATLGGEARSQLVAPEQLVRGPSLDDAVAAPYPLLTHRGGHAETLDVRRETGSRVVRVSVRPWMDDGESVAEHALAAATRGAKVLVIRNTVTDCIATQEHLERLAEAGTRADVLFTCEGRRAPHHARFARADRVALDHELKARFGRERPDGGCVVVATQTVQQSLDLDADLLVTDLCPADVLLQRIGRLHRHKRERPDGYDRPQVAVLVPSTRDLATLIKERGSARNHHGLGSVYPDLRIIEATWRLLEARPEWWIPEMNRLVVEHSLHSQVLEAIVREGGPRWQAHAIEVAGATRGEARQAELNLVDWTRPYADAPFPSAGDQRIPTRLGEDDRLAHFEPSIVSPFGRMVEDITVPGWWVPGLPADVSSAERVASGEGSADFDLGRYSFAYSRLGLQRRSAASTGHRQ